MSRWFPIGTEFSAISDFQNVLMLRITFLHHRDTTWSRAVVCFFTMSQTSKYHSLRLGLDLNTFKISFQKMCLCSPVLTDNTVTGKCDMWNARSVKLFYNNWITPRLYLLNAKTSLSTWCNDDHNVTQLLSHHTIISDIYLDYLIGNQV